MSRTPFLLTAVPVGLFLVLGSCSLPSERKKESAGQREGDLPREVLQLAAKHGADVEWLALLDGREFYTIELQQALLEPAGLPRLLIAPVVDVLKKEEAYFLTAHAWMNNVFFQLRCDAEQVEYVLSTSADEFRMFGNYAIIIAPESVHKPVAQLAGEIDADYAYVVHDAADIVVVKGTCLDILALGDDILDPEDLLDPDSQEKRREEEPDNSVEQPSWNEDGTPKVVVRRVKRGEEEPDDSVEQPSWNEDGTPNLVIRRER